MIPQSPESWQAQQPDQLSQLLSRFEVAAPQAQTFPRELLQVSVSEHFSLGYSSLSLSFSSFESVLETESAARKTESLHLSASWTSFRSQGLMSASNKK